MTVSTPSCEAAVAVCGIGMRLPSGLKTPAELYDFLVSGKDARGLPEVERYHSQAFTYAGHDGQPRALPAEGYWLDWAEVTGWDPAPFSSAGLATISQAEMEKMDPQQRLLLRVVWEALEGAAEGGRWRAAERASRIGCYVGSFGDDWREARGRDALDPPGYRLMGYTDFSLSSRVSHCFGLGGPSMTVRVACAAAGLALHLACQAIKAGECDAAIVAASNVILSPEFALLMAEQGILSPDASCRTFDSKASGYARAEAVNCLYIKRHDLAVRDGNPIRAVVRGSATNANGSIAGISTPNPEAQEALIRAAYRQAGIDDSEMSRTAMVECHGTGTVVGDAVETCALANVFGGGGMLIGSVKPALGHSEGASALTSIIKAIVSLENRVILPNIKFESPNLQIPFNAGRLTVPTAPLAWPDDRLERIGVSSFGIGGTNVHIILDSANSVPSTGQVPRSISTQVLPAGEKGTNDPRTRPKPKHKGKPTLLLLSAATEYSLQRVLELHRKYYRKHPERLQALAYTLNKRRLHLPLRTFFIVDENGDDEPAGIRQPRRSRSRSHPADAVAFVFTGPGSEWARMGVDLLKADGGFLDDVRAMDEVLQRLPSAHKPSWSIRSELVKPEAHTRLGEVDIANTVLTALQIALVRLLGRHGVHPGAVAGHSSGEIAASYAAGVLSLEDAIRTAYYGGFTRRHSDRGGGATLSVELGRKQAEPLLAATPSARAVRIACENSGSSVTLSGDTKGIQSVMDTIRRAFPDVAVEMLDATTVPLHFSHGEEARAGDGYHSLLQPFLCPRRPKVGFYSSVSGRALRSSTDFGPSYWRQNMASPVLFRQAIESLLAGSPTAAHLEIGPHAALSGPLHQMYAEAGVSTPYVSLMSRGSRTTATLLRALGTLHAHGVPVDVPGPDEDPQPLSDLDPYPWHLAGARWPETSAVRAWRLRAFPPHELLGVRSTDGSDTLATWRCLFSIDDVPWMRDHRVGGDVLFPTAAFVAMAGEIAFQLTRQEAYTVRELSMRTALVLVPGRSIEMLTSARTEGHGASRWWEFTVQSCRDGAWTQHCTGLVRSGRPVSLGSQLDIMRSSDEDKFLRTVDTVSWYRAMERVGYNYGPEFKGMEGITANVSSSSVRLTVKETRREGETASTLTSHKLHPTTMDKIMQSLIVASHGGQPRLLRRTYLPTYAEEIVVDPRPGNGPGRALDVQAVITTTDDGGTTRGSLAAGETGRPFPCDPVMSITGLRLAPAGSEGAACSEDHGAVQMVWKPDLDLADTARLLCPLTSPERASLQGRLQALGILCAAEVRDAVSGAPDAGPTKSSCPGYLGKLAAWSECYYLSSHREAPAPAPAPAPSPKDRREQMRRLCDGLRGTQASAAAELMFRCASHAASIFGGGVSPLDLLLQDDALHRLYDWLNSLWSYEPLLELLSHQRGNHLRALEVGAGTGGLTAQVLRHLESSSEDGGLHGTYVFTDVSAGFFPAARERFKDVSQVEYRVLDITRDPMGQGFQCEYDLVIASNVLHATADLVQTLRHVKSLLKPNGRLLLQELACETKWINMIMGFLPGWWLGESDGRATEPYISPQAWDERLRLAGFSSLESWSLDAEPPNHINATMIARPAASGAAHQPGHVTLLCAEMDDSYLQIVEELEAQLCRVGRETTRTTLERGEASLSGDVVCLLDLSRRGSFLDAFTQPELERLLRLLKDVEEADSALLWLTRPCQVNPADPSFAQAIGFARSVRQETRVNFNTLELDAVDEKAMRAVCKVLDKVSPARSSSSSSSSMDVDPDKEFVYVSQQDTILIPRCAWISVPSSLAATRPLSDDAPRMLQISRPGQLDSLEWVVRDERGFDARGPAPGMVQVRVEAAGLNFKDVLVAMGAESTRAGGDLLGCEASGTVTAAGAGVSGVGAGDRVVLLAPAARCLASSVQVPERLCAPIPDGLACGDAAGMPCVFATALRALADKARLGRGQTVLVHSAAGGVGLAAVQVARWLGAVVYATAGGEAKVEFLAREVGIPRGHIFSSRDDGFARHVMAATGGRGVDVVLNSLPGELLHASWRCVAPCGTFVELGKRDIAARGRLAMEPLGENRAFVGIDMADLAARSSRETSRLLRQVVQLYRDGAIVPVKPLRVFPCRDVAEAFRCLYGGAHIGKIVVDFGGGGAVDQSALPPAPAPLRPAVPAAVFSPDDAYVLVGGLRGLTASTARWMACHGARHLFFLSRTAGSSHEVPEARALLAELRGMGCTARALACDVADGDAVRAALSRVAGLRRVAGLVHLAAVLEDVELGRLTEGGWRAATRPKVAGAWNLHRALPPGPGPGAGVDFFVLVGSMHGVTGRAGQANYAAANAFLDSFAQYRRRLGLPCSVLDVGVVQEVGILTRRQEMLEAMKRTGLRPLGEQDFLDGMQLAMAISKPGADHARPQRDGTRAAWPPVPRFRSDAQVGIGFGCTLPLDDVQNRVLWRRDARMAFYSHAGRRSDGRRAGASSGTPALDDFVSRVSSNDNNDPAELDTPASARFLAGQIARRVLGFLMRDDDQSHVDGSLSSSLGELGMDSLMTIEIRNWWRRTFGVSVSLLQLTSAPNFDHLGKLAARQMRERLLGNAT